LTVQSRRPISHSN